MSMEEYQLYERDEPALDGMERELFDAVSREEPWSLVEAFSELEREPGTEDERRAAEFMEQRFEEYGVPYESYEPEFWIGEPESASMRIVSPVEETLGAGTNRPAIKAQSFSGSGSEQGELVRLDLPEADDVQELRGASLADLGEEDRVFEGKVVLVAQPLLSRQLVMELEERGAAAYVLVHPHEEEPHFGTAMPIWGAVPTPDQTDLVPEMIVMNVSRSVGDRLIELHENGDEVVVGIEANVPRRWIRSPLIVARISGEARPDNDDFVLLHGHSDSYHVGITDNATGNAGMVECARILNEYRNQLKRDLWIAFWPAHEGGRYGGSTWFADQFANEIYDRCVAHVNFDSPGVKDATEFGEMAVWMEEADYLCKSAIDDVAGKDATQNRPRRSGDYSFYNIGVTGLLALSSSIPKEIREKRGYHPVSGSGGNSEAWHLTTNTLDKADPDVLERDIRIYLIILSRLLTDPVLPLDYRQTVERHQEYVHKYDEIAGDQFDLSPVGDELEQLSEAVDELYEAIDRGDIAPQTADEAIVDLSRHLVPVNFTTEGRYEQDLAVGRPPYPSLKPVERLETLSGDEYRFQLRELVRSQNRVVHELREARRELPIE